MPYRATIRFDFKKTDTNQYQKLIAALMQAGWSYVATSALAVETSRLDEIRVALEVCSKQVFISGQLTGFSFDIQYSKDFAGVPYPGADKHKTALEDIRSLPFF